MSMAFDGYSSWLAFTLAHPDAIPSTHFFSKQQADGSRVQGTWLAPAVLQLVPETRATQETWVLSAGIHGDETAPIEWLSQLIERWRNQEWVLKVPTLLIMGNPRAMVWNQRFISTNLNRLFDPEQPSDQSSVDNVDAVDKHYEIHRALVVRKAVDQHFQAHPGQLVHYDLHTAIRESMYTNFAVCPITQTKLTPTAIQFLADAKVTAVLLNTHSRSNTFSYYSATAHQAEAATLEFGKALSFGSNDLAAFTSLTDAVLTRLQGQCLQCSVTPVQGERLSEYCKAKGFDITWFNIVGEVTRYTEHFESFMGDLTKNFAAFQAGSLIARDIDYEYRVGPVTEFIVFPNPKVQVGHRAALMATREG